MESEEKVKNRVRTILWKWAIGTKETEVTSTIKILIKELFSDTINIPKY